MMYLLHMRPSQAIAVAEEGMMRRVFSGATQPRPPLASDFQPLLKIAYKGKITATFHIIVLMTGDKYYRETPRLFGMQIDTNKEAIKMQRSQKGVSSNAASRTPCPCARSNMDPLTVRRFNSRGAVSLSDNAALVPPRLYYMSSLYSSIDRQNCFKCGVDQSLPPFFTASLRSLLSGR